MITIKEYIKKYRQISSNRTFFRDLLYYLIFVLCYFLLFSIIENIFYLSSFNRRNYSILFITSSTSLLLYILIKWSVCYNGILGTNSDENIAKRIGRKVPKIKDRLLNIIQIQGTYKNLDLTQLATNNIKSELNKTQLNKLFTTSFSNKIYLLLLLIIISFFSSINIRQASYRIINFNREFVPPTPFILENIDNYKNALSGDTINVSFKAIGEAPDSISLNWYKLGKLYTKAIPYKNGTYSHDFNNIQNSITYWSKYKSYSFFSSWDSIGTEPINLTVKKRPIIINNNFTVIPPDYTNQSNINYKGESTTQFEVLTGSKINFILESNKKLNSSWMLINNERIDLEVEDNFIKGEFSFTENTTLRVYCLDHSMLPNLNPTQFSFIKIEDFSPSIIVNKPNKEFEIDESFSIDLSFNVIDDYGLSDIWIEYQTISPEFSINEPIMKFSFSENFSKYSKQANIIYNWDIDNLGILMGDEIHFWILAQDNNSNYISITQTEKFIGRFPSLEDLFLDIENQEAQTNDWLEDIKETIEDISDVTEEVELQLLKEDEISLENEKKIEDSFEKIESIKEDIEELQENIEEILEQAEKNNLFDKDLLEKFNNFQNMLQDIMTPELMESMNKLQEALKDLDPKKLSEALENFEFNLEEFESQLDRFIDMFKMAQAEQKLNELSKMMENLLDKQNDLLEELKSDPTQTSLLNSKSQKQEGRFKNFEDLLNDSIEQIKLVSEETSYKLKELSEQNIIKKTSELLNQTTQNIVNQKTDDAMMSSEMSKNNLEDISEKINSIKEDFIKNSMQEVTNEFIIIINNTLVASNQQESLITKSNGIRSNSPEIRGINEAQNNINRELNQIMAQLLLLSNKTFAIKPAINRAFGKARSAIMNSITSFEQKKINSAITSQKDALNSINLVTQLLLDALDELQESGSPSGFEEFMASLEEMAKQQQGLNQSTMQLSQLGMMQQQGLLKELQSQQEQLKKQLQDLLGEFPGENDGSMEKIGKDMDEIIQDFKNKRITRETIKRQEQILSRMLDNQKSLTQKDFSNKRKGKTGQYFEYVGSEDLPENLGDKNLLLINAMESAMEEGYSNEYNKLLRNYFLKLQDDDQ